MTDSQNDESESLVLKTSFQGPTPPPAVLRQYEQVLPGSADRIFTMAEKAMEHQFSIERAASRRATLGLLLAPLVAIAGFASSVALVYLGQTAAGVALILTEVVALTALFFRRKSSGDGQGGGAT